MAAVVAERRGCRVSGGRQELAEGEELPFCCHRVPGNLCLDVYSSRFLWRLLRASVIPLQPESRVCWDSPVSGIERKEREFPVPGMRKADVKRFP